MHIPHLQLYEYHNLFPPEQELGPLFFFFPSHSFLSAPFSSTLSELFGLCGVWLSPVSPENNEWNVFDCSATRLLRTFLRPPLHSAYQTSTHANSDADRHAHTYTHAHNTSHSGFLTDDLSARLGLSVNVGSDGPATPHKPKHPSMTN